MYVWQANRPPLRAFWRSSDPTPQFRGQRHVVNAGGVVVVVVDGICGEEFGIRGFAVKSSTPPSPPFG